MKAQNIAVPISVLSRFIIDMKPAPDDEPLPGPGGPVSIGPEPIPWRLNFIRRDVERFLSDIRSQSRQIPVLVAEKDRAGATTALSLGIAAELDDWCGSTGKLKFPIPRPRSYELLMRGALIQEAAMRTSDATLKAPLEAGAVKLFDTAFGELGAVG